MSKSHLRSTLALSALALALSLPSCIFVAGEGWQDADELGHGKLSKYEKLEKRVATLEKHTLHQCTDDCPLCKPAP
ncbi:MAG: hypothetical protein ACT4PU_06210 [Planctomycetota bacterium]